MGQATLPLGAPGQGPSCLFRLLEGGSFQQLLVLRGLWMHYSGLSLGHHVAITLVCLSKETQSWIVVRTVKTDFTLKRLQRGKETSV